MTETQPISLEVLRQSMVNGEAVLLLQPIFDFSNGKPVFHEVLLRLLDERGEMLPPRAFLSTALEANLLPEIDMLTLHLLHTQLGIHREPLATPVSLNISRRTLTYAPYLEELAKPYWKDALKNVMFEAKVGDIVKDADAVRALKQLKEGGAALCIDYKQGGSRAVTLAADLGFGYLKINAAGVASKFTDEELQGVEEACEEARKRGMKLIFECIEDKHDAEAIHKYAPDMGQGYMFAHPVFTFAVRALEEKVMKLLKGGQDAA